MRAGLCLALAIAAAAPATSAAAQTFEVFRSFCLDTQGEPERVQAAVREAGWQVDPRTANLPEGTSLTILSDPSTGAAPGEMAMIGFMPSETGLMLPACSVMGTTAPDALVRAMNDWVGFEHGRTAQGTIVWVYTIGPDGMKSQPDLFDARDAEVLAAAASRGTIHMAQVRVTDGHPFMLHFRVPADAATTLPTH